MVDQFTFYLHQFLTTRLPAHPAAGGAPGQAGTAQGVPSMQQLLDFITSQRLSSEVQVRTDLFPRPLARLPVTHFFGGAAAAEGLEDGAAGLGGDGGASAASALRLLAGAQQGAEGEAPASTAVKLHSVSGSRAKLFGLLEAAGSGGGGDAERSSALVTAAAAAAAWVALAVLAGRVLKP